MDTDIYWLTLAVRSLATGIISTFVTGSGYVITNDNLVSYQPRAKYTYHKCLSICTFIKWFEGIIEHRGITRHLLPRFELVLALA